MAIAAIQTQLGAFSVFAAQCQLPGKKIRVVSKEPPHIGIRVQRESLDLLILLMINQMRRLSLVKQGWSYFNEADQIRTVTSQCLASTLQTIDNSQRRGHDRTEPLDSRQPGPQIA
jgi:hypothetical protein